MRGGGREGEVQIVVHGLPYAMAWQGLKDLVREHSLVEAARTTITMGGDGRSKGWGLVLLRNMQDAQAAIQVRRLCFSPFVFVGSVHVLLQHRSVYQVQRN